MNDLDKFNKEVNKQIGHKFTSENWSGRCPKFYKEDIPNLIKSIEIRKFTKKESFFCSLSIYSNFKAPNSPKGNKMHPYRQIFSVALTPDKVTCSSYHWLLKEDLSYNTNKINLLWEAIKTHGESFFNQFSNFPEPFLDIKPEDFINGDVELFDKYEVFHQVNYINFLKEIHLSLNQSETAVEFSNLAIERLNKTLKAKGVIIYDKAYKKEYNQYLKFLEMPPT